MQNLKRIEVDSLEVFSPESDAQLTFPPVLGLAGGAHADVSSPARILQQRLLEEMQAEAAEDDGQRWSPRMTLLFCSGVSMAIWGVVALGVAVLHH
jgi:hypothetical protein